MNTSLLVPLIIESFLYLMVCVSILYGLVFGYHWYAYGTSTTTATTALVVYAVGSGVLFFLMLTTYFLI